MVVRIDVASSLFQHEGQGGVPQAVLPCSMANQHQGPGEQAEQIRVGRSQTDALQGEHA